MASELYQKCCDLYHEHGYSAVFAFVRETQPEIPWEFCGLCEMSVPVEEKDCLVCGSPIE